MQVEGVAVAGAVSKQALECYVTGPSTEATASREGGAAAAVRKQASKMIKKNDTKKKRKQKYPIHGVKEQMLLKGNIIRKIIACGSY